MKDLVGREPLVPLGVKYSRHPLYPTWRTMLRRASPEGDYPGFEFEPSWDPKTTDKKRAFLTFLWDIGPRPLGPLQCQLFRLDKTKGYVRGNVIWLSKPLLLKINGIRAMRAVKKQRSSCSAAS